MPAYNEVLKLEGLTEEGANVDQAGQQLLDLCRFEPSKVEGKVPTKDYASLKKQSTYSNIAVGLKNMQQYKRLEDYLRLNGGMEMYCVQMREGIWTAWQNPDLNWNSCMPLVPVNVALALQTHGGNLKMNEWFLLYHCP